MIFAEHAHFTGFKSGNMTTPESTSKSHPAAGSVRRRSASGRLVGFLALVSIFCGLAVAAGFLWFVGRATDHSVATISATADGIVVFTGDHDRIAVATSLLAQGAGRRMLISGVNPATTLSALEDLVPDLERHSSCCIDLGREARDTIGNAKETAGWARDHGFTSLLVVTSAYHLPRSLAEMRGALPEVELTGVPVISTRLVAPWWQHSGSAKLLVGEYFKYLASLARMALKHDTMLANAGS